MIQNTEIIAIGLLLKPHGIKGEITMHIDRDVDVASLRCIVLNIDGIYVPFFIDSTRPRSSESVLISISGIDSEVKAQDICGKDVFALRTDINSFTSEDDSNGFYLSDLIGYKLVADNGTYLGEVESFDDSTENWLLIVKNENTTIYIPIADEFIVGINNKDLVLTMSLPDGLIDLN